MATNITPITKEYIVDMSSNNNFIQIPSVQGDGNYVRYVLITLVENGIPYYVPSNTAVYIVGTKPDNKYIFNECEIVHDSTRSLDTNRIKFEITSQMSAVEGRGEYQIMFIDTNNNSQIKSFPFNIITTRSFNADELTSTNEYQAIVDLVNQMVADYSHYVTECQTAANSANTSKNQAATSASNAATSATNAHTSEVNAKTSETKAKTSETNAKTSETNAKTSETNAVSSATSAGTSATNAHTSEVNAKSSETKAKTSETNAKASETAATTAATNAATSETNAATSETNAATSETNAKASENAAKTSETNAKTSETNAATSATEASDSATTAQEMAQESEAWAVGQRDGVDVPSTDATYQNNSKYWAQRAADWSQHDASHLTYTLEDGTQVNLAAFLKIIEDLDGETLLLL